MNSVRIAVVSPIRHTGASVISTLVAQALAIKGKSALLTYTAPDSPIPKYLGISSTNDPTRSVMQITRLLAAGSLSDEEILTYADKYDKEAYVLNTGDSTLTALEVTNMTETLYKRNAAHYSVVDLSTDFNSDLTQKVIDMADCVLIVTDTSPRGILGATQWLNTDLIKEKSAHVFTVVNHYNEVIASLREYAARLNQPPTKIIKVHYSPWITKMCDKGMLQTLLPVADELDSRVAALRNDMSETVSAVLSTEFQKQSKMSNLINRAKQLVRR